ncbi:MAG: NTP transferase domain-containing protein, partial [Leeuwenhoekiella sp.]
YYAVRQLEALGLKTYISLRDDQKKDTEYDYIIDGPKDMGPITGLLAAFETYMGAWLCMGCDYPLIEHSHLSKLIQERDRSKCATVFQDKRTKFLIPTLCIYEAEFFGLIKENIEKDQFSLQRILIENKCKIVPVEGEAYNSVDTIQEYDRIRRKLSISKGNC